MSYEIDQVNIEATAPFVEGPLAIRVDQYIKLREKRKQLKKLFQEQDAPLVEMENLLSSSIIKHLQTMGLENGRTKYGTCFVTTRYSASLADPDAFMKYVVMSNKFELLDRKANVTAVRDYVKEHKQLPPGANLSSILQVGVHKRVQTKE